MQQLNRSDVVDDRYSIVEELGRGGFGTVYRARHLGLEKDVALKTLNLEHAEITNSRRPEFFARFKKEAQSLTQLRHSSIVSVMDFGMVGDATPFLVMEYFPGEPLLKWGERQRPTLKQWLHVFREIFAALGHAHDTGVVHRDIKSANVLVSGTVDAPKVMLIDWGIAYSMGGSRLTGMGRVVGTTGFVDPENYVDPAAEYVPESDFYATGALLYQAICGREPFATSLDMTEAQREVVIHSNTIVAATEIVPDLPVAVEDLLNSLLATERKHRPPCALACIEAIDLLMRDEYPILDELFAPHRDVIASRPKPAPAVLKQQIDIEAEKQKLAAMRAEFEEARVRQSSVKKAEPPVAPVVKQEKNTVSLHPGAPVVDASVLPPPAAAEPPKVATPEALDKGAARYGYNAAAPEPWWKKRKHALVAGLAVLIVVALYLGRSGTKRAGESDKQLAATVFKPEDLEPKKDESALAKFAPAASAQSANSLSIFPPDIKAQYPPTVGGSLPPTPAGAVLSPSKDRRRDERIKVDEVDRSLKPVVAATDASSTGSAKSDSLSVPHNTTAEVRLMEDLDTSNDDFVRAELRSSLFVNGVLTLPAGSVLIGRASLRHNRAQARFDKVTLPNGTEYRIAAMAVTSDGREGIEGGRLEFGEPPPDKSGEKVLRAVGTVAAEAINSLPGGDVLTRSSQTVANNEMRDATTQQQELARSKNKIIIARREVLTVKFQAR